MAGTPGPVTGLFVDPVPVTGSQTLDPKLWATVRVGFQAPTMFDAQGQVSPTAQGALGYLILANSPAFTPPLHIGLAISSIPTFLTVLRGVPLTVSVTAVLNGGPTYDQVQPQGPAVLSACIIP